MEFAFEVQSMLHTQPVVGFVGALVIQGMGFVKLNPLRGRSGRDLTFYLY
jgi:hypothetical protein